MIGRHLRWVGLVVPFVMTGCVFSLYPLYTDADLAFDPALIGTWAESQDSTQTYTFSKSGEMEYSVNTVFSDGTKGEFVAHLLQLKGERLLDVFPSGELQSNKGQEGLFVPVHMIYHVRQIEPVLQLSSLSRDWLLKYLGEHPEAIRCKEVGENLALLLNETKELQAFVTMHLHTEGAFDHCGDLQRKAERPE